MEQRPDNRSNSCVIKSEFCKIIVVHVVVRLAPSPSRMRILEKKRTVILVAGERDLYFTRGYD